MSKKLFKNARLKGSQKLTDILVENEKFKKISPCQDKEKSNLEQIDLKGKLVLPPYVEPHIHLDYVYSISTTDFKNKSGTLIEGIQKWSEIKHDRSVEEVKEKARIAINKEILSGIQYVRTHVDVTEPNLTSLKAMLELREEYKDAITMQIVAFPQEGMYSYQYGDKLVEEAIHMGADVIGAIPHYEFTKELGELSLKKVFELAMKYDKLIDVHCDEIDDEESRFVESLATLAYLNSMGERTTASHTCAMGSYNNAYANKLFRILKLSNINFISCPTENMHLQGKGDTYPKRRGVTRVPELLDAGLNVCFAQDSISDPWYPLGSGNLMNILDAGIHISQLTTMEQIYNALDLITINGAKTMYIHDRYGIQEGHDANFIVLDSSDEYDAVRERAGVICSIRKGEYLFKKSPESYETKLQILK
ncbi:MAG: cytosine deaminase [Clostridiales bacterium]|jgi:cytosine deaminase|nr:cytosine deaminase [Clostridiales bacterium]